LFLKRVINRLSKGQGSRAESPERTQNMKSIYELRNSFILGDYNTSISREDFERAFTRTKESITFTFNGWDGKSYHGESRKARVIRCSLPGYEDGIFVKVGKALHWIDTDSMVTEEATGEEHPEADWVIDIRRA